MCNWLWLWLWLWCRKQSHRKVDILSVKSTNQRARWKMWVMVYSLESRYDICSRRFLLETTVPQTYGEVTSEVKEKAEQIWASHSYFCCFNLFILLYMLCNLFSCSCRSQRLTDMWYAFIFGNYDSCNIVLTSVRFKNRIGGNWKHLISYML